jgi:hypothetical protein
MQSVLVVTKVVSSIPHRGDHKVYNYMIEFLNNLWQVGGFLRVLLFPPPIKLTATIKLKYC